MSNILPAGTPAPDFTCLPRRTRRWRSRDCAADLLSWLFIQPIGARCVGTRWRSTTRSFPSFTVSTQSCWEFPWTVFGATPHFHAIASSAFLCSLISNPKALCRSFTEHSVTGEGVTERALFVIDKNGTIRWSYCSPIAVNPGADGILEALENLAK
jgi:hypothetical protein